MNAPRTLRLQRALASVVLDQDEAALLDDPGRVARRQELSAADQQSFRDQGPALMAYRELARMSLIEPLETMFPVLKALLEDADAWEDCVQEFLDARVVRSPHYRDIAPAFLGWLAATSWGQGRWPFLLELAHAEILEVLLARFPDSVGPEDLHPDPGPGDAVVLDPATQVVSYAHAVHRATEASPVPEARPTHLLAFRDDEGEARLKELTPATAALLMQAQSRPVSEAAADLGISDVIEALDLLRELRREGAIAGFHPPT